MPCSDHTKASAGFPLQYDTTYPRSSESNQDILVIIQNDFIKVASGNLNSSRRGWWLDLGLDTRLCGNAVMSALCSSLGGKGWLTSWPKNQDHVHLDNRQDQPIQQGTISKLIYKLHSHFGIESC